MVFFFFPFFLCMFVKQLCATAFILYVVLYVCLSLRGSISADNRWTLLSARNAKFCAQRVLLELVTFL